MEHIEIRSSSGKGDGIFARTNLAAGTSLFSAKDLAIVAVATSQLSSFCYTCYGGSNNPWPHHYGTTTPSTNIKICQGCKVAHFCNKKCQAQAWKERGHKKECGIFAALQPRILPEQVRAVMNFVLRRDHGLINDDLWQAILNATAHVEQLERQEETWSNLVLMAKACQWYSQTRTELKTILQLFCVLKVNGLTLTTAFGDPIGVFTDPVILKINHSCNANATVYRPLNTDAIDWRTKSSGRDPSKNPMTNSNMFTLLSLSSIAEGEELTFSYINVTRDVSWRQAELRNNYFFECSCPRCVTDLQEEDRGSDIPIASTQQYSDRVDDVLARLKDKPGDMKPAITELNAIIDSLEVLQNFNPKLDPYSRALHRLRLLYMDCGRSCDKALVCVMKQFLLADPTVYPISLHPTRITNAVYFYRLLVLFDDISNDRSTEDNTLQSQWKILQGSGLDSRWIRYWISATIHFLQKSLSTTDMSDLLDFLHKEHLHLDIQSAAQVIVPNQETLRAVEMKTRTLLGLSPDSWQRYVASNDKFSTLSSG